jgi:hypothetical protein
MFSGGAGDAHRSRRRALAPGAKDTLRVHGSFRYLIGEKSSGSTNIESTLTDPIG